MIKQDYYSGEPINLGSPNVLSDSEVAANNADFTKYSYGSNTRNFGYYQPTMQNPQPQQFGIGYPPYYYGYNNYNYNYGPQLGYSQYGNLQPMFGQGQQFQYQQPQQPTSYHIPGFNPGGSEFLPTPDWEDKVENLQMEYILAKQEADIQAEMNMQQSNYGNYNSWGYNYYGTPYYNPYAYTSIDNEYMQKINQIKDEARQNRINFNIQLSKLAHNILGDGVTEEEIIERCTGKDIPAPPQPTYQSQQDQWMQMRLANCVPFDNSSYYANARAAHIKEVQEILKPDMNMEETFKNLGVLAAKYEMEEEEHRRKDLSGSYSSQNNIYKYYVRRKAQERLAAEKGININNQDIQYGQDIQYNNFNKSFGNQILSGLPTLSQNATISDDGTLNVSLSLPVNVGSQKGTMYTVNNQNEAEYEMKRERFGKFLDAIKSDIYLDELKRKKFESTTFL